MSPLPDLYQHLNHRHFTCDLCFRATRTRSVFFNEYSDLQNHFVDAHFPCMEPGCVAAGHVVFMNEVDLAGHMVSVTLQGRWKCQLVVCVSLDAHVLVRVCACVHACVCICVRVCAAAYDESVK